MGGLTTGGLVAIGAIALVVVVMFITWIGGRYRKAGPDEALIVYGSGGRSVVTGGGRFILPMFQTVEVLSLRLMTLDVHTPEVLTSTGVPIIVDGVAQVKVDGETKNIITAAEQFLGKPEQEIRNAALQTLEGHLRAMIGTLTVEEVYREREKFAQQVQAQAVDDLGKMGLRIVSFTIREIKDSQGYLDALGKPRTAQVKRDAAIGEAEALRDSTIRTAQAQAASTAQAAAANRDGQVAKYQADTEVAAADRDYNMKLADYRASVQQQKAQSDLAYDLQKFKTQQGVQKEQVQVEVVEREMQIQVQEREIQRKTKELEATVQKPADAEKYRIQTMAEAEKMKRQTEAAGEGEAEKLLGQGRGAGIQAEGLAKAEVVKATGLAEAEVIRQKGFAEAEAMMKKAQAWQNYNQAAITEKVIEVLPAVASAIAQPLAKTERIVMVNTGGDGGGVGASRITRDVADIITQLPPVVEALAGVNFESLLAQLPKLMQSPEPGGPAGGQQTPPKQQT